MHCWAGRCFCVTDSVFLTGAAGFLGSQTARMILQQTNRPLIVLIRGRNLSDARQRLERTWWDWPDMVKEIGGRVRIVAGDLCDDRFGLDETDYAELAGRISHIIHMAADIRLTEPLDHLRRINVGGTCNVLALARETHRQHGLSRFSHVSTAYVAGSRKGRVAEEDLTDRYGFSNSYELSKFEAEALVHEAGKEIPVSVFRPGMVVGDSQSGAVKTFNTVYFPLRLYLTGKLKFFPVDPSMKINMVPGDYVAGAIARLTFDPQAEGKTFHLTLPPNTLPDVREMFSFTRVWAAEELHVKLPEPVFLPISVRRLQWLGRFFQDKSMVRSLLSLSSYFEEDRVYGRENLDRLMGVYSGSWSEFFPSILNYACKRGFMHRSERTVQEQAYFRLSGKSRPVCFFDVISGEFVSRSAEEVRREIDQAVSALRQMDILPGERIAVVGFNSSRYFILDTAIGLCGAVSVPMYYSSPAGELAEIVQDSGARLMFVGVPGILAQLACAGIAPDCMVSEKQDFPDIPVVSFCRDVPRKHRSDQYIEWHEFLKLGELPDACSSTKGQAPVGFGDIATLRYTSGTTGLPKGAVFDHAGLRYMAETLASLPPWKARTRKVVYLSFLPMNHVVEGILASYSIFYTPASAEVYYLESFYDLQKALPKIRPTVFFSVPRFYEKVWENASKTAIGRRYLKSRDGLTKRMLGKILGWAVKKKAGIDRCSQLIVGSAPVSIGLLQNLRSIGIEIHNAYGLTEAPLITLNRHTTNRIDTVGERLPDTLIRIPEDGEVLVKGPQVMRGYYSGACESVREDCESVLKDGWLHTGDFGSLTEDGYLVLSGRKKEAIISSYGKNINPVKIELMLREETGIEHVMLFGDNRPFCTALLFGSSPNDPAIAGAVEEGIQRVNRRLSHPEQIKKWVLLADRLTIEGGGLTANLKVKRSAVALKYAEVLEELYQS